MTLEVLELFKATPKALSVHEALAIRWIVQQAPIGGMFCSLGSHAGGDSIAAASAMTSGEICMVDPIYDLTNVEGWKESVQGSPEKMPWNYARDADFNAVVQERIRQASDYTVAPLLIGLSVKQWLAKEMAFKAFIYVMKEMNKEELGDLPESTAFSYVFSDADAHEYRQIMDEVALLEPCMVRGGIIAFHDYGNYSGPVRAHTELIKRPQWKDIVIPWPDIEKEADQLGGETGNLSWHEPENPRPCRIAAIAYGI